MKKPFLSLFLLLLTLTAGAQDFRFIDLGDGTVMLSYRIYVDEQGNVHRIENSYGGDIVIPETVDGKPVSRIAELTFDKCVGLTSITIPATVDTIAAAFYGCTALRKIVIADGEKPLKLEGSTGNYWGMFDTYYNHLNSLEEVYIGRNIVTGGGHSAFCNEVIKTITMGPYVTRLEDEAFRGCKGLNAIALGPNITSIGRQAFHECESLPAISIPDGVATIGEEAFQYCRALESIKMPAALQLILYNTFANCNSLKEIDIPAAVDSIAGAFYDCYSLRKLNIEDNAKPLKLDGSTGNYWGVFDTYYNHLNSLEEVYIGRNIITAGGHSAFCNENIKTVTMGDYVTRLEDEAFRGCKGLNAIALSPNLTFIGRLAFRDCESLPAISIPDGVATIGEEAFQYCRALESIKMPAALQLILHDTFAYCNSLKEIVIPAAVDSIAGAFYDCYSLKKLYIEDNAKPLKLDGSTGNYWGVFDTYYNHLNSLEEVYIGRNIITAGGHSAFCNENIKTVTMGDYVTRLEDEAFRGCKGLNAIALSPNLTFIGRLAFRDCESLPAISIPDGVTTIGEEAFQYCRALESIKMPAALQLILYNTFASCNSLKEIDIPAAVDSIAGAFYDCLSLKKLYIEDNAKPLKLDGSTGNYWGVFDTYYNHLNSLEEVYQGRDLITAGGHSAFSNEHIKTLTMSEYVTTLQEESFRYCRGLRSVTVSPNLTSIGRQAFNQCDSLPTISLPDGVATIGEEAFQYCRALESIKMPAALKLIQRSTFANCNSLKEIAIPAAVDSIESGAFSDCNSLRKLYIEDNTQPLKLAGSTGNYWGMFDTYYNHLNSLEEVYQGRNLITAGGHSAFSNEHIKTLTMGEYVTTLQEESFRYCRGLRSVTVSPNLTSIGRQAFHQCDSLPAISLPDGVVTIGDEAFNYCCALESIKMPSALKLIQTNTFAYCNSLQEIFIPAAVDSIGSGVFYDCRSLAKVTIEDSDKPLKLNGSSGNYWGLFDTYYNHVNSLKEVYVGRNLDVTGHHCPFYNENIETLTLGHLVTDISGEDYAYCNPTSLHSLAGVPPTCASPNVFKNIDKLSCALYVPEGSVDAYKSAFVWSEFFNIESGIGYVEIDMAEDKGDGEPEVIQRYTLDGRAGGQERGLNIIRMSDGTVRKVLVK